MTDIDRDNEQFNNGVTHTVDLLAKVIGATGWVAGDGSEDYDEDLGQTLLNILAAKGLFDPDTARYAALSPPEPTEGLRATLKPFAAEAEKLAEYFQDHAPDGERKVFRGSTLTFQNFRDAAAALRAMPLQEETKP